MTIKRPDREPDFEIELNSGRIERFWIPEGINHEIIDNNYYSDVGLVKITVVNGKLCWIDSEGKPEPFEETYHQLGDDDAYIINNKSFDEAYQDYLSKVQEALEKELGLHEETQDAR